MSVLQLRICVWCLRNLLFLLVANSYISHGLSREFNEAVVKKLFIGEYPNIKNNIAKVNLMQSSMTLSTGKNKANHNDKYFENDWRRRRVSGNLRLKRSTLLADEDLFEFMVRIANTPAEWERIRRVLSRIKQEETSWSPSVQLGSSTVAPHPSADSRRGDGAPAAARQPPEKWPSGQWIRDMVEADAASRHESYAEAEADREDESDEWDDGPADAARPVGSDGGVEIESPNATRGGDRLSPPSRRAKLVPNSRLPNFVYRRVLPDSRGARNSAYIAVSAVSNATTTTTTTTTTKRTEGDDASIFGENTLLELETKRRHSKKKSCE